MLIFNGVEMPKDAQAMFDELSVPGDLLRLASAVHTELSIQVLVWLGEKRVRDLQQAIDDYKAGLAAKDGRKYGMTNEELEKEALASFLAVNSALTVEDFKAMPLARLRELKAKSTAGAGARSGADEFEGYSLNALIDGKA